MQLNVFDNRNYRTKRSENVFDVVEPLPSLECVFSVFMYCLEYDGKEILNAKQFVFYALVAFMDDVRRS